jgi:adenine-specific DNA-methyltransferase
MDKSTLQQKLNQPYTTDNWREIVQYVFPNVQIFNPPQVIPVDNDKVETFRQLGNVILQDGKTLALFELKLKSNVNILRNRVELNTIVSQYIDQERTHGVLSIFEQGTDDYRFTFSAKATEFDEESGDFQSQKTDTKRYTYVLGRNESCKTPAARFAELAEKKANTNIQSIQDAFSVEKLSKEFFKEYKVHYLRMVDYLLTTDAYKRGTFHGDEKAVRDFVKLLMGRLVFIQFVQKKRWMGVPADISGWHDGPVNFLYQGFLDFEYKETFYSAFLEPLFYDTLNTPNRQGDLFAVTGNKVPYLNGGLFEEGERDTSLINFPEAYFSDLLEFFDRYNFTIDENDPNEHEVGIDPEMLGHIFENLLEDNKDKGAYYTPKEIVHYMCQESLKEYLKTRLEAKGVWPAASEQATEMEHSLEAFVKRKEAAGIIDHDGILAQALRDVKICDPAIGSGAFPMGLLTEIFRCMFVIYHASPDTVGEIWGMEAWQPETVKKNIIQNSIYGVDIERGAVDIARLRFWLSLIVDEPEPHALPNLDYKIVVGNSLVSKLDDDIIDIDWEVKAGAQANAFGIANVERRKVLLQSISTKQKAYFDPTCDKETVGHDIRNLKIDLLINQLEEMVNTKGIESQPVGSGKSITQQTERYLQTLGWKQSIRKLEAIKNDREAHLHFFDWKLDFPEVMNQQVTKKVGFDIVIGNPPYVDSENMTLNTPLLREYLKKNYYTTKGNWDLFVPFIELGIKLNSLNGIFTYIIPNKVLSATYTFELRSFMSQNKIIEIRDYSRLNIFKDANVYPVTLLIKKNSEKSDIRMTIMEAIEKVKKSNSIDPKVFYKDFLWDKYFFDDHYIKILIKLSLQPNFGSIENFKILGAATVNEAYLIKEMILDSDIINESKKLINTGTIDKWVSLWGSKKTQYIKDAYTFPIILDSELKKINITRLYQAEKSKIIIAGMSNEIEAFLDINGEYLAGKSTSIIIDNIENLKIYCAILNSKVASFFVKINFHSLKMAGGYLNINNEILNSIPLPKLNLNSRIKLEELVSNIMICKAKSKNTSLLEYEIDNLIYKLYELTYDEVLVVEPEFGDRMSRDEYESLTLE